MIDNALRVVVYAALWILLLVVIRKWNHRIYNEGYAAGTADAMKRVNDKLNEMENRSAYPEMFKED